MKKKNLPPIILILGIGVLIGYVLADDRLYRLIKLLF